MNCHRCRSAIPETDISYCVGTGDPQDCSLCKADQTVCKHAAVLLCESCHSEYQTIEQRVASLFLQGRIRLEGEDPWIRIVYRQVERAKH